MAAGRFHYRLVLHYADGREDGGGGFDPDRPFDVGDGFFDPDSNRHWRVVQKTVERDHRDGAEFEQLRCEAEVFFVLGMKTRVPVTDDAAGLVRGWTLESGIALGELRAKIAKALRDEPHEVVVTDDVHRRELFSILAEMERRKSPLEDGLPQLKAAASEPITLL